MAIFDSLDETTDHAIDRTEAFLKSSEAYYELKLFQMLSSSLSLIIKFTLLGALFLIAFIFIAAAIANTIGDALDSVVKGYLATAGIFIFLGLLIFVFRKSIENLIVKKLSTKIYETKS
ncbi:hypothetical protein ACFQ1Q_02880 [Winogradskyella litorisediminis]|uniref:Superfamily III holin-X n=1 Tax=Winogradskyella litorisediminis TaxID=1156618 RepID=A0ABW3N387_9FLAO